MTEFRFRHADQLTLIEGGTPELATRLARGDTKIERTDAIVVREPGLPGAPYYLVIGGDELDKLKRRLSSKRSELVGELIGIGPSVIVEPDDAGIHRAIVVADGDVIGAWLPREKKRRFRGIAGVVTACAAAVMDSVGLSRTAERSQEAEQSRATPPDSQPYVQPTDMPTDFGHFGPPWSVGPSRGGGRAGGDGGAVGGGVAVGGGGAADGGGPPAGGAPPGGGGGGDDPLVRRTPHLDAPEPLPVTRGMRFEVRVWTDDAPARIGEEAEDVVVEAPPDVREVELDVLLITSAHLAVPGAYFQPLTIIRDEPDSQPVVFDVEVVDPDAPGDAELIAQFLYRGRPCGRLRRQWRWPDGTSLPAEDNPAGVPLHTDSVAPDMTVIITAIGGGTAYTCSVWVPDLPGYEQPTPALEWPLREAADTIITRTLGKLVDRRNRLDERRLALRTAGRAFWSAAPSAFRNALWALIDHRRVGNAEGRATVYIASDEPHLPWELMLPSRPRAGDADEDLGLPLGAAFAVGRWVRGDSSSPPQVLRVRDSFLIAPRYEGKEEQLDCTDELTVLENHFNGHRLEHGSFEWLDGYLKTNTASLLHFVCHGAADGEDSVIFLDDFVECSSAAVRESEGFQVACRKRFPIVFLNACDAGRGNATLGPGGAGFPMVFGQLGARAIIAPLWPVTKLNAPVVAKEIYEQAIADPNRSLADVLAELRSRSYEREPFDDSWAAYVLFGDPLAKLQCEIV